MICKKCQTRNPNNSDHCIRCGAKFNKNSGFNYFIAFIASLSLCVILAVVFVIHMLSDEKKDLEKNNDFLAAGQSYTAQTYDDYVAVQHILEQLGAEDFSVRSDNDMYTCIFTLRDKKFILNFSADLKMLTYRHYDDMTFSTYELDNVVKIVGGDVTVPRSEFESFIASLTAGSPAEEQDVLIQVD